MIWLFAARTVLGVREKTKRGKINPVIRDDLRNKCKKAEKEFFTQIPS
jgi:hypothetical protein